jgi:hypothetical protein
MRQAITTKHLPATNHRGSRIKASCEAGTITVSWDYALDAQDNHKAAALALIQKLGWSGLAGGSDWYGGSPGKNAKGYVFVHAVSYAKVA